MTFGIAPGMALAPMFTQPELATLAKFAALWAAVPTALVALIAAIIQGVVARLQARASAESARAAKLAADAALENARLKEEEMQREAVAFLSTQRREEIGELRTILVNFYSLAYSEDIFTAENVHRLRQLRGEIELRLTPDVSHQTALIEKAGAVYEAARTGDIEKLDDLQEAFIQCAQQKLHYDLQLIESQVERGRID